MPKKNRYINTHFWSDNYISDLDPIEKLLFLYLLTNEKTTICGVYELPLKYMAVETGIEKEMIEKILKRFQEEKKVFYYDGWVAISNFIKHRNENNIKIKRGIEICLAEIPCKILNMFKSYRYIIDKSYIKDVCLPNNPNPNPNPNPNLNSKLKDIYVRFQNKINKNSKLTDKAKDKIKLRLKNFSKDELLKAIDNFSKDSWWMENNSSRGVAWFFHTDERIDQLINLKPKNKPKNYIL